MKILSIVILIGLFVYMSGMTITLKPLSIKFERLWSSIGYALIIAGCVFIQLQGYRDGKKEANENEIIFDFEKQIKH